MYNHRSRNAGRGTLSIQLALIFLLLLTGAVTGYAAPPPADATGFEVVTLPASALTMPAEFAQAMAAPGNPKMDSDLAALAAGSAASSDTLAMASASGLRVLADRIQVQITTHAEGVQAVTEAVAAAGGEVTGRANGDTWLQAWLPVPALATLAAEADVYYLSRPAEPILLEPDFAPAATTEGLAVINGPAWQAAGFRGAGVKVAIIDGGFQGYPGLRGTDLPASVTAKNFVDGESDAQVNGTTVHGTACAEIVYDIAPNATLYLVKVGTNIDLQEAVTWVMGQGVNIISTSLGWYNLAPGDGTGFFANLVQTARNAGIFWTTAASNDREAHWGGAFNDPDGNGYHNFSGTQEVNFFGPGTGAAYNIPAGYAVRVFLRWDDWTAVNQNYDLSVVKWNGSAWQIIATSANPQNGSAGQTPTEYVGVVSSGSAAPYGFIVKRVSSNRNVNMEIFAPKVARLDKIVTARSLANLADSPAAITVAALDVKAPYPQESYSSEGPANGPGGTAAGGAIKPDISGFANVSTVSYGTTDKFNGTSAATPHVAGAAALVKGAYPAYTPAQIQNFLQGRAIDMGAAGKDTIYGYGRLYLGAAPNPATTRKTFLPLSRKSATPAPPAPVLNPIDNADGNGSYTVTWNAAGGATSYTLQEDDNAGFTSPSPKYTGPSTSWNATGYSGGTFYYRVNASNTSGVSAWSNTVSAVVQAQPSGPTPGFWQENGEWMEFYVSADRQRVEQFALYVDVNGCGSYKITRTSAVTISGNSFSFTGTFYGSGTFSSSTLASGTVGLNNFNISGCGNVSGGPWAWNASWMHSAQVTASGAGQGNLAERTENPATVKAALAQ